MYYNNLEWISKEVVVTYINVLLSGEGADRHENFTQIIRCPILYSHWIPSEYTQPKCLIPRHTNAGIPYNF